jgi:N-hydroxyarylamine O-acetyltransferase
MQHDVALDRHLDADHLAYLQRLGLEPEPPSVAALDRLHRAQLERVPYETAWIHMGDLWTVDRRASLDRVANRRRGGYCFHANGALSLLLEALGYRVTLHPGGVHGPDGPQREAMDNHLVLLVHGLPDERCPDGTWWVDAGLGDALHGPLPLVEGVHRAEPFEFRLERVDLGYADWRFHHHPEGSFTGLAFSTAPTTIDHFAACNVRLSTSPDSMFVQTLTVQRRDAGGTDMLRGKVLTRLTATGRESHALESREEWFGVLRERFDLPLDDVDDDARDRLWERVHSTHEAWLARPDDAVAPDQSC